MESLAWIMNLLQAMKVPWQCKSSLLVGIELCEHFSISTIISSKIQTFLQLEEDLTEEEEPAK